MIRRNIKMALFLIMFISFNINAQDFGQTNDYMLQKSLRPVEKKSKNEIEDWYFHFSLGYPVNSYPSDTKELIQTLKDESGVSTLPLGFEFGVYWNLGNNHTIIGPIMTFTGETFSKDKVSFDYTIGQISASVHHYIMSFIGEGLYGRADLGVAFASMSLSDERRTLSEQGNMGFAFLLGAGWGLPISSGTRLTFSADYAFRTLPGYEAGEQKGSDVFEKGNYTSFLFMLGILW